MILHDLLNQKPTKRWNVSMIDGDDLFTEDRLLMSDKVLDEYLNKLLLLHETKNQEKIMKAVEEIVIAFNDLNDENDYFIDTMEREELVEFIEKAAMITGLNIEDGEDITEEWREW